MYFFVKHLSVRDKQSYSCLSIDYKPPLVSREDKHNKILTSVKTREKREPNKHGEPNPPNMAVLIEHDIAGQKFLLLPQKYVPHDIIKYKFLLLPQEDDHKCWSRIVTLIDTHNPTV